MDKRAKITLIIVTTLFLINFLFTVYLCLFKLNNQEIVSFNMKNTVDTFLSQLKSSNLDEKQIQDVTQKFNAVLDESIKFYSQDRNVLILVKPAVVYGINDVTEDIQELISEKMAN